MGSPCQFRAARGRPKSGGLLDGDGLVLGVAIDLMDGYASEGRNKSAFYLLNPAKWKLPKLTAVRGAMLTSPAL